MIRAYLHNSAWHALTLIFVSRMAFLLEKALPLPVVAALIRLGRKYSFQRLLDSAVERLTFENPSTLEEFDALNSESPLGTAYTPSRIAPYQGLLFDMLTLGRENDILSTLPCAYYRLVKRYSQVIRFSEVRETLSTHFCRRNCSMGSQEAMEPQLLSL
jgi:hypothetical protein